MELTETIDRLIELIRKDASHIDTSLAEEGAALLALFTDDVMAKKDRDFTPCRETALRDAIEDLANGGQILSRGTIGVKYADGSLAPFIQEMSSTNQINTAFSIRLKTTAAFKSWRRGESVEIPQEKLNAGVYYLVVQLAIHGDVG